MNRDALKTALQRAVTLHARGDPLGAAAACREALAVMPGQPHTLALLGRIERQFGNFDAAADCLGKALRIAPDIPEVVAECGYLSLARDDGAAAAGHFTRLTKLQPEFADAWYNLGQALKLTGRRERAIAAYRRALELGVEDPAEVHTRIGFTLTLERREQEAEASFKTALALDSRRGEPWYGLGTVSAARGEFDEARRQYMRAIELQPDLVEVYRHLADSRRYETPDEPEVRLMLAALGNPRLGDYGREKLHFALGKVYDDCREYGRAFTHFQAANELKKARIEPYDADRYDGYLGRVMDVFNADFFAHRVTRVQTTPTPILIVGMPRSGTTLVEQILSSHSRVAGAGEQTCLEIAAVRELAPYPLALREPQEAALERIREEYLDVLRRYADGHAFVTDKFPANFTHLGLFRRLFPDAPIVHCRRDPRDTCLSVYFQDFGQGNIYAYDLTDVGRACRSYTRLMSHWGEVLPGGFYTVDYERMVADQQTVTRELLAHCGLEWEDGCLDFAANRRLVETLSRWQVRQPIYTDSLARWRRYEAHLGPLLAALGPVPGGSRESAGPGSRADLPGNR